jgi:hypothetical protein
MGALNKSLSEIAYEKNANLPSRYINDFGGA